MGVGERALRRAAVRPDGDMGLQGDVGVRLPPEAGFRFDFGPGPRI
jgi:hypothetical protein